MMKEFWGMSAAQLCAVLMVGIFAGAAGCTGSDTPGDPDAGDELDVEVGPETDPPDECLLDCGANGECVGTGDESSCACDDGYEVVADTCVDRNECAQTGDDAVCREDQDCENTEGGYLCDCPEGLSEVDGICVEPDSGLTRATGLNIDVEGSEATLTWNAVEGADGYELHLLESFGDTPDASTLVETVSELSWETTLPEGALTMPAFRATPYEGDDAPTLRNDGVGIELTSAPAREPGQERNFVVVPVRTDEAANYSLSSSVVSGFASGFELECRWELDSPNDGGVLWTEVALTDVGGVQVHVTAEAGTLSYRCVPVEDGVVVDELNEGELAYGDLPLAVGRVGTCDDGERAIAAFETYTDCGGTCAESCQQPTWVGDNGPFEVLHGESQEVDLLWSARPPVTEIMVDGPDWLAPVTTPIEDAQVLIQGLAESLGSGSFTVRANNEITEESGVPAEVELDYTIRERAVEHLSIGSFGCAVFEGNLYKCFGQNPLGIHGRGDDRNPGVLSPTHQVPMLPLAAEGGAVPAPDESVVALNVGRSVACAVIEDSVGDRRLSCWGGTGDLGIIPDEATLSGYLHVSTIDAGNTIYGDEANEIPGTLAADNALAGAVDDAVSVFVGLPWTCLLGADDELTCAQGASSSTISDVVDFWHTASSIYSCVTTSSAAWCSNVMPEALDTSAGSINLPSGLMALPAQRVAYVSSYDALVVLDANGSLFVAARGGSGSPPDNLDGDVSFNWPSGAQAVGVDDVVVSSNAVCAISGTNASCWGHGRERFDGELLPAGVLAATTSNINYRLDDPDAVTFSPVEEISGERWFLNANAICAADVGSDELHCRQGVDSSIDVWEPAVTRARDEGELCAPQDTTCQLDALVGALTQVFPAIIQGVISGADSLRPAWLPADEFVFTHHLVEGPPVSYGPVLPQYYVDGNSWVLPFWFADGDGDAITYVVEDQNGVLSRANAFCRSTTLDGSDVNDCYEYIGGASGSFGTVTYEASDRPGESESGSAMVVGLAEPQSLQVAVGQAHVCSLRTTPSYALDCWGSNAFGQLGLPTINYRGSYDMWASTDTPQRVTIGSGAIAPEAVAAGEFHTCVLLDQNATTAPQVLCAGNNENGQVNPDPAGPVGCTPGDDCYCAGSDCVVDRFDVDNAISFGPDILAIRALEMGPDYSCAIAELSSRDAIVCWGDTSFTTSSTCSTQVPGATQGVVELHYEAGDALDIAEVHSVGAGFRHLCFSGKLDNSSSRGIYCIGANDRLQRGGAAPAGACFNTQSIVDVGQAELTVDAGRDFTCAADTSPRNYPDGGYLCWGTNERGQLGRGTLTPQSGADGSSSGYVKLQDEVGDSVRVTSSSFANSDRGALFVGADHACAVDAGGQLLCWGENRGYFNFDYVEGGTMTADPQDAQTEAARRDAYPFFVPGRLGAGYQNFYSPFARSAGFGFGRFFGGGAFGPTTCGIIASGELKCFGPSVLNEDARPGTWGDDELGLYGPAVAFP